MFLKFCCLMFLYFVLRLYYMRISCQTCNLGKNISIKKPGTNFHHLQLESVSTGLYIYYIMRTVSCPWGEPWSSVSSLHYNNTKKKFPKQGGPRKKMKYFRWRCFNLLSLSDYKLFWISTNFFWGDSDFFLTSPYL